jgi:hypothetical protein
LAGQLLRELATAVTNFLEYKYKLAFSKPIAWREKIIGALALWYSAQSYCTYLPALLPSPGKDFRPVTRANMALVVLPDGLFCFKKKIFAENGLTWLRYFNLQK